MSAILRVRDNKGVVHDIPAIVGPKGDPGETYDDSWVRANINELKEDLVSNAVAISPKMRNGSIYNTSNPRAIATLNIVPRNFGDIIIKTPKSDTAMYYRFQLTLYSTDNGKTEGNPNRMVSDYNFDNSENYIIIPSEVLYAAKGIGIALYLMDTEKNIIPIRVTDYDEISALTIYYLGTENYIYDNNFLNLISKKNVTFDRKNFLHASLSGATGDIKFSGQNVLRRIVTKDIQIGNNEKISIKDGYRIYFVFYDENNVKKENSGWITSSYTLEKGVRYRLEIAKIDETSYTFVPLEELINVATYTTPLLEKIQNLSPEEDKSICKMRNGSVTNISNQNGIASENIIPINGYDKINIKFDKNLQKNHKYIYQITVYDIDVGLTGSDVVSHRIMSDINLYSEDGIITLGSTFLTGIAKGIGVAIYEEDNEKNRIPLRIDDMENPYISVFYGIGDENLSQCIDTMLLAHKVKVSLLGKLSLLQSFCIYNNKIFSTNGSEIAVQDFNFAEINRVSLDVGHGNSFQVGKNNKAYISGWNDNKLYVINLDTLSISDTIDLPTSGYTTACIDEKRNIAYIFQRDTSPHTEESYNFIVYDLETMTIISSTKTIPFGAMQACDYFEDKIIVCYGLHTDDLPNGIRVFNTCGNVLATYNIDDNIFNELEGVFVDKINGCIVISDTGGTLHKLELVN